MTGRRSLLKAAALVGVWAVSGCSAPVLGTAGTGRPAGSGATIFVSPDGDDRHSGLDMDNAWRTIRHVNSQIAAGIVGPGDTVLFERGQTFFGKLRPVGGGDEILTFGQYATRRTPGTAGRPVISSYKLLNTPSGWTRVDDRTWRVDLASGKVGTTHTGYDGSQGGSDNIGFLRVDGAIKGRGVRRATDLVEQWDFLNLDGSLVVRSDSNPCTIAADIRAACDLPCVEMQDHLEIWGLKFEGSGGHGLGGTASHVRIHDNEIAEIGGSWLDERTRYGNGVEVWIRSSDVVFENNIVHDVYDAGMTMQGSADTDSDGWVDIVFRNNLVYCCNQSIEFWSAAQGHDAPGFEGCSVEGNVCLFAGYGWSAAPRPDKDTMVQILTYGWELPADIQVRRNVFYDGRSAYRSSETRPTGLINEDNVILQRAGYALLVGDPIGVEDNERWVSVQGSDQGSTFVVLPADVGLDVTAAIRQIGSAAPNRILPVNPAYALLRS